jgi:hypothetical protein
VVPRQGLERVQFSSLAAARSSDEKNGGAGAYTNGGLAAKLSDPRPFCLIVVIFAREIEFGHWRVHMVHAVIVESLRADPRSGPGSDAPDFTGMFIEPEQVHATPAQRGIEALFLSPVPREVESANRSRFHNVTLTSSRRFAKA